MFTDCMWPRTECVVVSNGPVPRWREYLRQKSWLKVKEPKNLIALFGGKICLTAVWQLPIGWLYVNSGLALARRDLAAAGAWPIGRGGRPSPTRDGDPAARAPSWPWPGFGVALPPPSSCRPGSKQRWSEATPETGLSSCRDLCTHGSPLFSGDFTTTGDIECCSFLFF